MIMADVIKDESLLMTMSANDQDSESKSKGTTNQSSSEMADSNLLSVITQVIGNFSKRQRHRRKARRSATKERSCS